MDAYFPVEWKFGDRPSDGIGGQAVDDAGTVYVVREEDVDEDWPVGDTSAGMLVKKTTVAEMVAHCIDGWRGRDGHTDKGHIAQSDDLAAALRAAADMLDAAKPPTP